MKHRLTGVTRALPLILGALLVGCSTTPDPPLAYIALERPDGPIACRGWYFGNYNFRPVPDVHAYLEQAHASSGSEVLCQANVVLNVPAAIDILFFGYAHGTDLVSVGMQDGQQDAQGEQGKQEKE